LNSLAAHKLALEESRLIIGKAPIVRAVFEKRDISSLWDKLFARVSADLGDAAAFLDVSILLHSIGQEAQAAISQKAALEISRQYCIRNGDGTGLNVLVFVTAGDFMANTPIEFLLEESDANIFLYYIDGQTKQLADAPPHDVALMAIGESEANGPALERLEILLRDWHRPVVNHAPRRVMELSRDAVAEALKDETSVLAQTIAHISRDTMAGLASGEIPIHDVLQGAVLPIIARPVGTHAGKGMEKIDSLVELEAYLASRPENEFYVTPFIDYSDADGKFRKQRIVLIDGKPYASHMAISDHWMVHYLSAGMLDHEDRRAEEAAWMTGFDEGFAVRHASAFEALYRRLGLDYFAIDCAELSDGRLLLFEADVAMIVHSMDPETVFPYKKPAMTKLFLAFEDALKKRVAPAGKAIDHEIATSRPAAP
jgi:hypothetical protein